MPRAGVAQLVEYKLPKLGVAGSNPVARSISSREFSATGPHPRGLGLLGAFIDVRSLLVRALSSARRLAADGGSPGSLRSRRVRNEFFSTLLEPRRPPWDCLVESLITARALPRRLPVSGARRLLRRPHPKHPRGAGRTPSS